MKKTGYFLHLMPDSVYSVDYINKVNRLYAVQDHLFYIYAYNMGEKRKYDLRNVRVNSGFAQKTYIHFLSLIKNAKGLYLHSLYLDKYGLFWISGISLLLHMPISWVIWGGDLVEEYKNEQKIKGIMVRKRIKRFCRKIIIKKLTTIISLPDDYSYAVKHYDTRAGYRNLLYAYEYRNDGLSEKGNTIKLLAGHSATVYDKHIELYRLLRSNNFNGEVYSVLSYDGSSDYVKDVCSYGRREFGERYHPILKWMKKNEYLNILSSMSIAVFMAERQTAVGNILLLVYTGAKIFSHDYGIIPLLKKEGAIIYSISDISAESIKIGLTLEEQRANRKIAEKIMSDDYFKSKWDELFLSKEKEYRK